jgi:hypothetical protein
LHEANHGVSHGAEAIPAVGAILAGVTPMLLNGCVGIVAGAVILAATSVGQREWRGMRPKET